MKKQYIAVLAALFVFLGQSVLFADGIGFDPDSDGSNEIIFHPDGGIESVNAEERINSLYGEYIDFNDMGDDHICLGSEGTTGVKHLCVSFKGDDPAIITKSNSLSMDGNLRVWRQAGEPTNLTVQSDGNQQARVLFNEYQYARGEIFSEGRDNSFNINSLHSAGLYLNRANKFNVKIATGGGKTAIGHENPDTVLDVNGAITIRERNSEPPNPDEGAAVIWMSNGTGTGNKGDIMIKVTSNNATKIKTLVAF